MLFTEATFVKKNSCLVARIISFGTAGLLLLAFRILEPYPSSLVTVTLSRINDIAIVPTLQLSFI